MKPWVGFTMYMEKKVAARYSVAQYRSITIVPLSLPDMVRARRGTTQNESVGNMVVKYDARF